MLCPAFSHQLRVAVAAGASGLALHPAASAEAVPPAQPNGARRAILEHASAAPQPQGTDIASLQNRIDSARNYGLDVVAAAGNEDAPIDSPASSSHVVAVGAGAPSHSFCSFSNRGPGLSLIAPGCSLDAADPTT